MIHKAFSVILPLTLSAAAVFAQTPIPLETDDVYFQYTPARVFTPSGTPTIAHAQPGQARLCGFSIRGNHRDRANPHVEWDMNIDEIIAGSTQVAGITAGAFDVVNHVRKGRAPIVAMDFNIAGDADTISARIVGVPNMDNAVKAMLETEPANRLFVAFSDARPITVKLAYSDGTAHDLLIRSWHDYREFGGGKNSFFNECLRGFTPHNVDSFAKAP